MTYAEIVRDVMDRLNLSSDDAASRVLRNLHTRYKRVTSSIGLIPSRRTRVTAVTVAGNRDLTFTGIEKLDVVGRTVSGKDKPLKEVTSDEILVEPLNSGPPEKFAIRSMTPTTVTIRHDIATSVTTTYTLFAEGLASVSRLAPDDSPAFPESYHDVLIYGVMADEYLKKEQFEFVQKAEADFEERLSALRMFIAKSAYLDIYQGKNRDRDGWWDQGLLS